MVEFDMIIIVRHTILGITNDSSINSHYLAKQYYLEDIDGWIDNFTHCSYIIIELHNHIDKYTLVRSF